MVYKVQHVRCNMLLIKPGISGWTPSLYDIALWSLMQYTTHGTNGFTSHPKDEASWLNVLLKDIDVTAGDSNPHTADQKHQSLNSVLLTNRAWHAYSQDKIIHGK